MPIESPLNPPFNHHKKNIRAPMATRRPAALRKNKSYQAHASTLVETLKTRPPLMVLKWLISWGFTRPGNDCYSSLFKMAIEIVSFPSYIAW